MLGEIRQSLAQRNAATLRLAAHSLKSNSAEFGATTLSEICRDLEARGKAATWEGVDNLVDEAEQAYEQVELALRALRSSA